MAIQVKHSKVSTIPDADDTSLVRPSDWNADHTLTGTIDIINGGTGASTAASAINNLLPTQSGQSGKYLGTDGTNPLWLTVPSAGGGSSVSYYLNGGTNQGTFGGNTYYQMSKTAVTGTAANFTIAANGYIAQFLTDANDPALLNIPAGNWNFEMFFSSSSAGGTPSFYVELYKYNGTTFTLISSGSSSPEVITGGTVKDVYTTALAVPATSLTLTDRLAVRVYVNNSGRTITLYTQDANLCQVITTFSTGITALNGLTAQVQTFATGMTGTDFNISSVTDTHTFNIPSSSASNRGLLTSGDWSTFNSKVTSVSGTAPVVSSGGTTPTISMPAATASVNGYLTSTDWTTFNNKQPAGTYVTSVSGTTSRITSSGGTTPAIDLASGIVTAGTTGSSTLIPVITVDTYGRVTNVTTAANPQGTVTSVGGTGTVSGISLSGTVTSSGNLTLGGSLDLSSPPAIGGTTANSGRFTSVTNTGLTSGRVPYSTTNGLQTDSANLTFNGTTLTVNDLTDSSLTSGRVVYAGTGGNLVNSANLTFDGTTLTANTIGSTRINPRVSTTMSSATPTINTDTTDIFGLTAQTVDITSFTTNLSGTPVNGQRLWIYIVGTAARAITWGASFEASTVPLPTTTVSTNRLDVGFVWNAATSKWRCVASA